MRETSILVYFLAPAGMDLRQAIEGNLKKR